MRCPRRVTRARSWGRVEAEATYELFAADALRFDAVVVAYFECLPGVCQSGSPFGCRIHGRSLGRFPEKPNLQSGPAKTVAVTRQVAKTVVNLPTHGLGMDSRARRTRHSMPTPPAASDRRPKNAACSTALRKTNESVSGHPRTTVDDDGRRRDGELNRRVNAGNRWANTTFSLIRASSEACNRHPGYRCRSR